MEANAILVIKVIQNDIYILLIQYVALHCKTHHYLYNYVCAECGVDNCDECYNAYHCSKWLSINFIKNYSNKK